MNMNLPDLTGAYDRADRLGREFYAAYIAALAARGEFHHEKWEQLKDRYRESIREAVADVLLDVAGKP